MSWINILVPELTQFKSMAGWSDAPSPTPVETTTTFDYSITPGEYVDITWNQRQGEKIKSAKTYFPMGGWSLVHDAQWEPVIMSKIKEAMQNAGCTNIDTSWDGVDMLFKYLYNGQQTVFTMSCVEEPTFIKEAEASDNLIDVYAVRQRMLTEDLYTSDMGEYTLGYTYQDPGSVGMLGTAEGESIGMDTSMFSDFYDITFDPDTGALHMQVVEWYYMQTAEVTTTT